MTMTLVRQWIAAPFTNYRLFHNFTRQDFFGQFTASIGGFFWLFTVLAAIASAGAVAALILPSERPLPVPQAAE